MPVGPDLVIAYLSAEYVVYGEPELVLRIGEPSDGLDALLEAEGADAAAYVTAANPHGRLAGKAENVLASTALLHAQRDAGYACFAGEGRDPQNEWPAEPSVLVVGISRAEAEVLGRSYGQNAIVFVEKGSAPELVMLAAQG
ncbi:MAG: DUF3293 domain-containing protein [Betaproteobacteria bacterium]|nr:DUF3293 domain-containing protein [Betaproteobacteria bacterium]